MIKETTNDFGKIVTANSQKWQVVQPLGGDHYLAIPWYGAASIPGQVYVIHADNQENNDD